MTKSEMEERLEKEKARLKTLDDYANQLAQSLSETGSEMSKITGKIELLTEMIKNQENA